MENSLNDIPEEMILSIMTYLGPKYLNNLKIIIDKKKFEKYHNNLIQYISNYAVKYNLQSNNLENTSVLIELSPCYKITLINASNTEIKKIIINKFFQDKKSEIYFKNWLNNIK